jgi:NAD(P)-dependent dehydrogenase (short-subunit alcohol dehydrogenase family)
MSERIKDWRRKNWVFDASKPFDLTGKSVIVTGAGSGIGRAITLGIDAMGGNVVLADIVEEGMEEVAKELKNDYLTLKVDVTSETDVKNMVEQTLAKFGKIDGSFNAPAINFRLPFLELSADQWTKVWNVNIGGVCLCAREVGKVMVKQKYGSMVNIASFRGLVGAKEGRQSIYSASKGAVVILTKCLAAEWGEFNVRVNAIAPGMTKTPLVTQILKDEEWYNELASMHVLNRFAEPEEMAGAAIFLVSDASTFITGTTLLVDGGLTAV